MCNRNKLPSTDIQTHTHLHTHRVWLVNSHCCVAVVEEIRQQLLERCVSWPPLQAITHKYVVIPVFNSLLWTKMHSSPFSVQPCLGSWPFCPYPISWCIFSKSSKPRAAAAAEVSLCCWYMWVKEESFENRKIGILPSAKWKGVYKAWTILLNVWPEQTDIQWKYSKCKYCCTCSITFVPLYTQKHLEGCAGPRFN